MLLEDLSQSGYSLHPAENAEKALKLFKQKAIGLVVSDIQLPDMNRLQLPEHMKDHSVFSPVIPMADYESIQDGVEGIKKGL